MQRLSDLSRHWRSPQFPLLFATFCVITGMGMVWSVLAIYAESIGASTALIGTMLAVFGGARLLTNVPAGIASERFGRRRLVLGGLAVLAAGSYAVPLVEGIPALLVCLFLQGVGSAVFTTATLAAVADLSMPDSRVRDMAAFQGSMMLGLSIGPAIGGFAAASIGYGAPFALQGSMALLGIGVLLLGAGRPRPAAPPAAAAAHGREGAVLGRMAALALLTSGVFFARVACNWVLLPLIATRYAAMSLSEIGLVLTAGAVANLLGVTAAGTAARRFGRLPLIVGASLIALAGIAALGFVGSPLPVWIAGLLLGGAMGLAVPPLYAYVADLAPPGRLGAAMGTMRMATDIGIVFGPVATGAVVDGLGLGYGGGLWAAAAVLIAANALFLLTIGRGSPRA